MVDYDQPLASPCGVHPKHSYVGGPRWTEFSSAKPTRSGDECKTSGHTFKGQVGHLTLTIAYTIDSVRLALFQLRERLASGEM